MRIMLFGSYMNVVYNLGSDQYIGCNHNRNYLGILELVSKYNTFMSTHIEKYAAKVLYITKFI